MILACVDGGLICGPVLITLVGALLGWLGLRRCRKHSDCGEDH
jgi:hypothetical protein